MRLGGGSRDRGDLCIVLHSHMPYVEGFGTWPFGEEWLFEATASAYLPLLERCERWADEGRSGVLTVGVTPVLADQLALPVVAERLLSFLRDTRARCHVLDIAGFEREGQHGAADALRQSERDYASAAERFDSLGGDLLGLLRRLRDAGTIELWTSAATHAILPLLATEAGMRLQVLTGVESHRRRFERWGGGFWLPECAFRPGIDEQLATAGVRAFCVDQTDHGDPLDQLEPTMTPGGAVAVPIDWQTIALVWDERGYPADPVYRDYHAPSLNGLRPYANSGQAYDVEAAARRAVEHGCEFVASVSERLECYRAERGRPGLLVCALDTELLGHWWYEGPLWLDAIVEQASDAGVRLASLPEALERHEPRPRRLAASSWGRGKDFSTWDSPKVADLVWTARRAELALVGALTPEVAGGPARPAAERAARELLALQSSDWAFMTACDLAADYPGKRIAQHAERFRRVAAAIGSSVADSRHEMGAPDPIDATDPIDPRLGGLAPGLRLSSLLTPPALWAREPAG